jgi:DNA-binding MarR family transcriptional regulator
MTSGPLDPLIHNPERLRVIATLAELPDGDTLSVTRLQDMIRLPPGSLITCLHQLYQARYVRTQKAGDDAAETTVTLTRAGRAALDRYTAVLRRLPRVAMENHQPPAPEVRAGDTDRDAAAAALGEHFAQGRLTLDELNARLEATLTATTHGELSQAARDLPHLTMLPACGGFSGGRRAARRRNRGPAPGHGTWLLRRSQARGGSS